MIKKSLGGDRLGSGNRMKVAMRNYERSSHNQSTVIRTDQAVGTLVPYYCQFALNGTTAEIGIETKVRTLPTNGPIFGSFKHQIDVFQVPIRLYIAALHNNVLGIGRDMKKIKMPMMKLTVKTYNPKRHRNINTFQISSSSLLAYLGLRGLGMKSSSANTYVFKQALLVLTYWDIYKNYYANKQEEKGAAITADPVNVIDAYQLKPDGTIGSSFKNGGWTEYVEWQAGDKFYLEFNNPISKEEIENHPITINSGSRETTIGSCFKLVREEEPGRIFWYEPRFQFNFDAPDVTDGDLEGFKPTIKIDTFPLKNIDEMREKLLAAPKSSPYIINTAAGKNTLPYGYSCGYDIPDENGYPGIASQTDQAGLGLRTYLSDRFNNWLSTDWIEGENGVNDITAVDVSDGKLTMDSLILQKKLYNLLNRIAISGGTYNDWQEAVYGEKTIRMAESPIYEGGLSSEITFDEVVSTSETQTEYGVQPLGSLAGRGSDHYTKSEGKIKIRVSEPSIIMAIGSIVPRLDYSQGNKWWTELETMDDFHKPELDAIGFQELDVQQMAAWDLKVGASGKETTFSAGKQPSWIEYMTDVNEVYGSFAAGESLDFMTLTRAYSYDENTGHIKDLTTYIDPTIWNRPFADASITAKNFWVQVGFDVVMRRKMSAKQIPNL